MGSRHQYLNKSTNSVLGVNNDHLDKYLNFEIDVAVDLRGYEFRQIRNQYAAVDINIMKFKFTSQINRSLLTIDREKDLDYALVVQNYLTSQSHIVAKNKDGLVRFTPLSDDKFSSKEHLSNGSTFSIYCQPWVAVDLNKANVHAKLNIPLNLKLIPDADFEFGFEQVTS